MFFRLNNSILFWIDQYCNRIEFNYLEYLALIFSFFFFFFIFPTFLLFWSLQLNKSLIFLFFISLKIIFPLWTKYAQQMDDRWKQGPGSVQTEPRENRIRTRTDIFKTGSWTWTKPNLWSARVWEPVQKNRFGPKTFLKISAHRSQNWPILVPGWKA